MRRKLTAKRQPPPDLRHQSAKVSKFVNYVMREGKKEIARRIVYGAFDEIAKGGEDPLEVFEAALRNVGPSMEIRSRRVGGANYQVPREVRPERRLALAMRWIIEIARAKRGPMAKALAEELRAAGKGEGAAVKKKEDTHKMAEANRAFAHFAW